MNVRLVDPLAAGWAAVLDSIGLRLGQPHDPALFPYHFLHTTLGRIGGRAVLVDDDQGPSGAGFLFPRQRDRGGAHVYTLRYHAFPGRQAPDPHDLVQRISPLLNGCAVYFYDPYASQHFVSTHHLYTTVDIGQPDEREAAAVPALHHAIWSSPPEFIYPADLFSTDFAAGTGLVARVGEGSDQRVVGFLAAFYKFFGPPLPADWHERFGGDYRLESQIMGVLPEYRGLRIASLLKQAQAEQARREGVNVVNWTADPLQYPNAALNFGLLRAVTFDFVADMYPFRNELNRVPASRFLLTWLVGSQRVRDSASPAARATVVDLSQQPQIGRVNAGWAHTDFNVTSAMIAVEIPAAWTDLQNRDVAEAIRWRTATDALLAHYVGVEAGQYTITGVGVDGDRRYLIGERSGESLWVRLGAW